MTLTERINGVPVDDGMFGTVEEDDYHADRGSLSQSGAKILISKGGPAKFRERMTNPPKPKPEFTFGHAAHALVLGKGANILDVDAPDWRTKAAREARDQASNSVAPMLTHELAKARTMAAEVKQHPIAGPLFERGHAEVSLYATDDETGVRLRGRCDWVTIVDLGLGEQPVIVDYKTVIEGGADEDVFTRKAFDYGYYMQHPWYQRIYAHAMHTAWPRFLFVVQEKVAPYLVNVIELDAEATELGEEKMSDAIRIYAECTRTNDWPGYAPKIHRGSLPRYAFARRGNTLADLIDMDAL
jgi:hypothetical protein